MSDLHKDPWVMQRVATALDAIRYSDREGLETELDLLAFADDLLDRQEAELRERIIKEIIKEIEAERDHPGRGWNDYNPSNVQETSDALLRGIKEGMTTAINTVKINTVKRGGGA